MKFCTRLAPRIRSLAFLVVAEPLVHSVKLTVVSDDELQGEVEIPMDGGKMTGKLTFAREK